MNNGNNNKTKLKPRPHKLLVITHKKICIIRIRWNRKNL